MAQLNIRTVQGFFVAAGLLMGSLGTARPAIAAVPTAQPPYSLSVFAKSANGYSQPDSIVQWRDSIFVGFQNHVAKDGTDGKSSTIVQYSLDGKVLRTFTVPGHNDGLRIVGEDKLWSLQNEDANPNLVIIDLESGQQKLYGFAPTVHGGGYDDLVVKHGEVFISVSNPTLNGAGATSSLRSSVPRFTVTWLTSSPFSESATMPLTFPQARRFNLTLLTQIP